MLPFVLVVIIYLLYLVLLAVAYVILPFKVAYRFFWDDDSVGINTVCKVIGFLLGNK